jgi:precorrin-3B methylase
MSTKTIEGGLLALQQSDVVMVTYNPTYSEEQIVITKANELNKGVLIKKALVSGHIQKIEGEDPIATSLKFIAREPGVSNIVIGTLNSDHLKQNVICLSKKIRK